MTECDAEDSGWFHSHGLCACSHGIAVQVSVKRPGACSIFTYPATHDSRGRIFLAKTGKTTQGRRSAKLVGAWILLWLFKHGSGFQVCLYGSQGCFKNRAHNELILCSFHDVKGCYPTTRVKKTSQVNLSTLLQLRLDDTLVYTALSGAWYYDGTNTPLTPFGATN